MYNHFFKLAQSPFSIAPDPRYLFMSERHREALAHLLYGVDGGGGFVLLTGEIGAGKTTVCRCFLEQIPANCNVAYIFNPKLTVIELLKSICDEFGITLSRQLAAPSVKDYVDALNAFLLATHSAGQNNVLIIDEAQNLSPDVLEQLRLLTNLETNERKLLQIILIGQPELRSMLARRELEQLAQRVIARYHLASLSEHETVRYIAHRWSVASLDAGSPAAEEPFQRKAALQIHRIARGVPRRINLLCDRALLGAYAEGKRQVDRRILRKAAAEVFGNDGKGIHGNNAATAANGANTDRRKRYFAGAAGLSVVALVVAAWLVQHDPRLSSFTLEGSATAAPQPAMADRAPVPTTPTASPATQSVMGSALDVGANEPAITAVASTGQMAGPADGGALAQPVSTELGSAFSGGPPDEQRIYGDMAKLWGLSLPVGEPCQGAQKQDLHCYRSTGGLAEIRQLDRPAVVTLRDRANRTRPVLLTGLTNISATLMVDGRLRIVSLIELGRYFHGDFTTFWRAPQKQRIKIALGDRGAEVDWLARQLAKLNDMEEPAPNQSFDRHMLRRLLAFQTAHGLQADGVAGPKTFMYLNRIAGVAEPRLNSAALAETSGK